MFEVIQVLIGLASLLVAIIVGRSRLKSWWHSKAVFTWKHEVSQTVQGLRSIGLWLPRRQFLALSGAVAGIVFTSFAAFRLVRGMSALPSRLAVVHKQTKVIHDAEICQDHLPSTKNRLSGPIPHTAHYHSDRAVRILVELARHAPDEEAIRLLLLARDLRPSAVHVYDMLIRDLGRLKRYEAIHLLLNDAERELSKLMSAEASGSRRFREYMRAKEAIVMRRRFVNNRAARAAHAAMRVR